MHTNTSSLWSSVNNLPLRHLHLRTFKISKLTFSLLFHLPTPSVDVNIGTSKNSSPSSQLFPCGCPSGLSDGDTIDCSRLKSITWIGTRGPGSYKLNLWNQQTNLEWALASTTCQIRLSLAVLFLIDEALRHRLETNLISTSSLLSLLLSTGTDSMVCS